MTDDSTGSGSGPTASLGVAAPGLPPDAREAFEARAVHQSFAPRQVIVRQGDPADRVFLVDSGRVKSVVCNDEGCRSALEVLGPGQVFGEAALLDDVPSYVTTVSGMDRGMLLSIAREDFLSVLGQFPQETIKLLGAMTRRVRRLSERVESGSMGLPKRLARVLLLLLAELGTPLEVEPTRDPLNVSQQDLGEFVGAARESVNRQLRTWERQGIVQLRRGRVVVTNPQVLDQLSKHA